MVLGKRGLGKSSFIDHFLEKVSNNLNSTNKFNYFSRIIQSKIIKRFKMIIISESNKVFSSLDFHHFNSKRIQNF